LLLVVVGQRRHRHVGEQPYYPHDDAGRDLAAAFVVPGLQDIMRLQPQLAAQQAEVDALIRGG
jgi:hypothetical protein